MKLGIIDVGTNSIHLVIASMERGAVRVLRHDRTLARLGAGGLTRRALRRAAVARAIAVLRRYRRLLARHGVEAIEAVATSAVREARNGRLFVRRIRRSLGLPLRILDGREEARLIYQGVRWGNRLRGGCLVIAIGGGSAEVIYGIGDAIRYAASLPLGCARLAERFIHHDPPRAEELAALRAHVRQAWSPVVQALRRRRFRQALGSSATIHQVARAAARRGDRLPAGQAGLTDPHPPSVSRQGLRRLIQRLSRSTASERRRIPGLDPARQGLALPTSLILLAWMEGCRVSRLSCAPGSLREGLALQHLRRLMGGHPRYSMSSGFPLQ